MKKSSKTAFSVFGLALVVLLLLVMIAVAHAYWVESHAKRFLAVLQQVQVGSSTEADVLRMTEGFRSFQSSINQELGFSFYNIWAARLKLAEPTLFLATITFKEGIVVKKSAAEMTGAAGPFAGASVTERKRDASWPSDRANRTVHWQEHDPRIAASKVRRVFVDEDNTCPQSQRERDWAFDLGCLSRLGHGCMDAKSMLPSVSPDQ